MNELHRFRRDGHRRRRIEVRHRDHDPAVAAHLHGTLPDDEAQTLLDDVHKAASEVDADAGIAAADCAVAGTGSVGGTIVIGGRSVSAVSVEPASATVPVRITGIVAGVS